MKKIWASHATPAGEEDWALVMDIVRDILLLYHEQSEYTGLMGDLGWGSVYNLPYWNYLNETGLEPELRSFIRDGCLVMIVVMATDVFEGQCLYLRKNLDDCLARVRSLKILLIEDLIENSQTEKLIYVACLALETIQNGEEENDELRALFQWVYNTYISGYFKNRANRHGTDA